MVAKIVGSLLFLLHQKKILHKTLHKNSSYTEADHSWTGWKVFGGWDFWTFRALIRF